MNEALVPEEFVLIEQFIDDLLWAARSRPRSPIRRLSWQFVQGGSAKCVLPWQIFPSFSSFLYVPDYIVSECKWF